MKLPQNIDDRQQSRSSRERYEREDQRFRHSEAYREAKRRYQEEEKERQAHRKALRQKTGRGKRDGWFQLFKRPQESIQDLRREALREEREERRAASLKRAQATADLLYRDDRDAAAGYGQNAYGSSDLRPRDFSEMGGADSRDGFRDQGSFQDEGAQFRTQSQASQYADQGLASQAPEAYEKRPYESEADFALRREHVQEELSTTLRDQRRERELALRSQEANQAQAISRETAKQLAEYRKRQSRVQALTTLLFVLAAIGLTILIIHSMLNRSRPTPNLVVVQEGTLSDRFDMYGLLARDETVLQSPANGIFEPYVAEGTRIGIGDRVGRIVSESEFDDTSNRIRELNRSISSEIIKLLSNRAYPDAVRVYAETDAELLPTIQLIQRNAMNADTSELLENTNSINILMASRNAAIDKLNFVDPIISEMRERKAAYEEDLEARSSILTTPQSGLVSYRIQDSDQIPLPTDLENMTFDALKTRLSELRASHRSVGQVKAGDKIVRLITGGTQYFLIQIDGARSADFPEDKLLSLEIKAESMPVDQVRILKVTPNSRGVLLLCSSQSQVERLLRRTVVEGKVLMNSDRGLLVPISALMMDQDQARGTADIFILRSGYVHRETVRVKLKDSDQALLEPLDASKSLLSAGSIVIANPSVVKEGQSVE